MTNTTANDIKNLAADLSLQATSIEARSTTGNTRTAIYLEGVAQGLRNAAVRVAELASVIDMQDDAAERKAEDREYWAAKAVAAGVR